MRAITVSAYGSRPAVTELPIPQAGPGQVLSHAVYVSRPAVVAAVIAQAAQGLNGQG